MKPGSLAHRHVRAFISIAALACAAGCAAPRRITEGTARIHAMSREVARHTQDALVVNERTMGASSFLNDRAAAASEPSVSRRASRPWIGARMTAVRSGDALPPIFSESFKLDFDDRATRGRVSIAVIAERLSRMTRVPVRVQQDVYALPRAGAVADPVVARPSSLASPVIPAPLPGAPLPVGLPAMSPMKKSGLAPLGATDLGTGSIEDPSSAIGVSAPFREAITDVSSLEMRWDGTLSSFLDHVTGRLNLSWSYRDDAVVIERYITENFEIAGFVGTQDFKMSTSGSAAGVTGGAGMSSGGASSTMDVNAGGRIAALDSLRRSIESMVQPAGGSVTLSEGSGRLTVTAPRDVMSQAREVLRHEMASMQRQAHIQFDVYSVTTTDADERGVNWELVIRDIAATWNARITSPASLTGVTAGGMSYSILQANEGVTPTNAQAKFGGSAAVLNLLHQISDTATYRPISMQAMNREWKTKGNVKTVGYISETTPATASSVGSGAPGLKTSTVTTGDKLIVQPAILDNGVILLKFGLSLSELLGLFDQTTGSGTSLQKVQTPNTASADEQGTVRLAPGQVMVISGLSRQVATGDRRTLAEGAPDWIGGGRKLGYAREDFIVVVRAVQI